MSKDFDDIKNWVNTPDDIHIRRVVKRYKSKFPAMASISAITHCEMEEAYKLYDMYKEQLEKENPLNIACSSCNSYDEKNDYCTNFGIYINSDDSCKFYQRDVTE